MNSLVFLEIPVEVFEVTFSVERDDPLQKIFDNLPEEMGQSNMEIFYLLNAIKKTSSFTEISEEISVKIVRDLWKGKFWTPGVLNHSIDTNESGTIKNIDKIEFLKIKEQFLSKLDLLMDYSASYVESIVWNGMNYKVALVKQDYYWEADLINLWRKLSLLGEIQVLRM